jgi:hypothetical protein
MTRAVCPRLSFLINERSNQLHQGLMLRTMLLREKCDYFHSRRFAPGILVRFMNDIDVSSFAVQNQAYPQA